MKTLFYIVLDEKEFLLYDTHCNYLIPKKFLKNIILYVNAYRYGIKILII